MQYQFRSTESGERYRRPVVLQYRGLVMNKAHLAPALALLLLGCDPDDDAGDEGGKPIGVLEFGGQVSEIYRDDRRVDVIPVSEPNRGPSCGYLTDRAYRELQDTLDALDSTVDYDFELGDQECKYTDSPAAQVYVEGFEHSPFSCDFFCCRPELAAIPTVYLHVTSNLDGMVLEVDGEPYVAIAPDQPCP